MKTRPIRLINLGKIEWWKTQAYYHSVAELMKEDSPDTIILCSTSTPYLCLGYHQKYEDIFDSSKCDELNLPVIRRSIGGGATYLDSNQLFYQFIFHNSRAPKSFNQIFSHFLTLPASLLKDFKINPELVLPNEIEVEGKRIAGTGGGLINDAVVIVGNYLFDFNFETMTSVWNCPNEDFRTLALEALKENLITIKQIDVSLTQIKIKNLFIKEARTYFDRPVIEGDLCKKEKSLAESLKEKMIDSEYLQQTDIHESNNFSKHPLKISANSFIYYEEFDFNKMLVKASYYVHQNKIRKSILRNIENKRCIDIENQIINQTYQDRMEILNANHEKKLC